MGEMKKKRAPIYFLAPATQASRVERFSHDVTAAILVFQYNERRPKKILGELNSFLM